MIVFVPKQLHINDGELLSSVPCREFWCASFPCFWKPQILKVSANIEPNLENTQKYNMFPRCTHFYFWTPKIPENILLSLPCRASKRGCFRNTHFDFVDVQNPNMSFGNRSGLTKRFLDFQNPKMSFGNRSGLTERFLHVQNPKMSFGNLQGLTKRTFLFYGPMAPGAHRAHIFLINVFIYLFIYVCI